MLLQMYFQLTIILFSRELSDSSFSKILHEKIPTWNPTPVKLPELTLVRGKVLAKINPNKFTSDVGNVVVTYFVIHKCKVSLRKARMSHI